MLSKECIEQIEKEYRNYCKKTGRNGGVLIPQSIREIATHLVNYCLTTPSIYESANLIPLDEALAFAEWVDYIGTHDYHQTNKFWYGSNSRLTTKELYTVFKQETHVK